MKKLLLYQILAFIIHENIIQQLYNNKFKISARTWNDEFVLTDGSNSISDIQDFFEYI